jgi:hypothetical protein
LFFTKESGVDSFSTFLEVFSKERKNQSTWEYKSNVAFTQGRVYMLRCPFTQGQEDKDALLKWVSLLTCQSEESICIGHVIGVDHENEIIIVIFEDVSSKTSRGRCANVSFKRNDIIWISLRM